MMNQITAAFMMLRQRLRRSLRGQTMTEYAFVLAAIALVVYATYQLLGTDITVKVQQVNTLLAGS